MTTYVITHDLFIEALTQSLCSWNVLSLSNKQNAHFSLLYSNNEIKQCNHVIDVTTYEKLMNVGGLNDNGVIAYALVPRRWSESLCLRTELCDFHAKCTFLSTAEDSEARTDRQSERKPALPLYTLFQCVESKRLLQK